MYPFDSPTISTSLSSSESSSLDFIIRSSDEMLRSMCMDDCAFNDFTPIDEYNENARSDSSTETHLPLPGTIDVLFASLREKSTGSILLQ